MRKLVLVLVGIGILACTGDLITTALGVTSGHAREANAVPASVMGTLGFWPGLLLTVGGRMLAFLVIAWGVRSLPARWVHAGLLGIALVAVTYTSLIVTSNVIVLTRV